MGLPFSTFRAPQALGRWLGNEGIGRIYEAARQMTAGDIMNRKVVTVTEEQAMIEAVALMLRHDINRIPVLRDKAPVGSSRSRLARHMLTQLI